MLDADDQYAGHQEGAGISVRKSGVQINSGSGNDFVTPGIIGNDPSVPGEFLFASGTFRIATSNDLSRPGDKAAFNFLMHGVRGQRDFTNLKTTYNSIDGKKIEHEICYPVMRI